MFKKFIKITGIILLVGFISVFIRGYKYQETKSKQEDKVVQTSKEEKQDLIDEEVISSLLDEEDKNQKVSETLEQKTIIPEDKKKDVKVTEEKKTQPKQEVPISKPIAKQESTVQEKKEEIKTSTITPTEDPKEEKKQEIWEVLGMSEDQYYNKPLYSWERIDFKTYDECYAYGDTYYPAKSGEVLYNCREITSMSGKFLGIMFDTEKTN